MDAAVSSSVVDHAVMSDVSENLSVAATMANMAGSQPAHTCPPTNATSLATSDEEVKGNGSEISRRIPAHSDSHKRKGGAHHYCNQDDCTTELSSKEKHHVDRQRVCDKCYRKKLRQDHSVVAAASSSSSSSTSSFASDSFLQRPITRSFLPAPPSSVGYLTHDWEISPPSDLSLQLAAKWVAVTRDPRYAAMRKSYTQDDKNFTQISVVTEQHHWRELGKLANQTENYIRKVCIEVRKNALPLMQNLHVAAIKILEVAPYHGWQQAHYDAISFDLGKEIVSALFYCTNTMSTEFPIYDKNTMRPCFIDGQIASPSEQERIERLSADQNLRSYPVSAGSTAIFNGTVLHRAPANPNPAPRVLVYFLFSHSYAKFQDGKIRIPNPIASHAPLTTQRRWSIIAYHELGLSALAIALKVGCTPKTVYHWLAKYRDNHTVDDEPRAGRNQLITPDFATAARQHPLSATPRMLKAELKANVSKRTIRRRLNDDSLFGRVARRHYQYTPDIIRQRLSFANGYKDWTDEQWMSALYSDEKGFTLGQHGRVWVQRPPGTAYQPQYCYEYPGHSAKVNFWCIFNGRGTGGCETYSENLNSDIMRGILQYHLKNTQQKLLGLEQCWLLWDNPGIHKEESVRRVLHNHSITTLEFPPYSPDLNPTENLFSDLARRVEQHFPTTIDELEDALHEEWPLTNTIYLQQLAKSMRHRIKAVLDNHGGATKY